MCNQNTGFFTFCNPFRSSLLNTPSRMSELPLLPNKVSLALLHDHLVPPHCHAFPRAVLYLQGLVVHHPVLISPQPMAAIHVDPAPSMVEAQVVPAYLPRLGEVPGLYIPLLVLVRRTGLGSDLGSKTLNICQMPKIYQLV